MQSQFIDESSGCIKKHQEAARSNKEKQVIIPEQQKTDGVCELKPKAKTQGCKATERELMNLEGKLHHYRGKVAPTVQLKRIIKLLDFKKQLGV